MSEVKKKEKAKFSFSIAIISCMFGFLQIVTSQYLHGKTINNIFNSPLKNLALFLAYAVIFYASIAVILPKILDSKRDLKKGKITKLVFEKHTFAGPLVILSICFAPILTIFYPGLLTSDTFDELSQFYHVDTWTIHSINLIDESNYINSHHSPFHTVVIGTINNIGINLTGKANGGLYLNVLLQAVIMIIVLAYSLSLMSKLKVKIWIRWLTLIFYAISPFFAIWAINVVKDTPFAIFTLLYVCQIIDISLTEKLKTRKAFALITTSVLLFLLNNKGLYIVGATSLMLLFTVKSPWKYGIAASVAVLYFGYNSLLLPTLKVTPGSKRELMSLPVQQIARVAKKNGYATNEIIEKINRGIPYKSIGKKYNPELSDPVKKLFKKDANSSDITTFLSGWIELGIKNPSLYFDAFMDLYAANLNISHYNKPAYWTISKSRPIPQLNYVNKGSKKLPQKIIRNSYKVIGKIPGLRLFMNFAFYIFGTIILCFAVLRKKFKYIVPFIPALIIIAFCFVSSCSHRRYVLPIIYSFPILFAYCVIINNKEARYMKKNNIVKTISNVVKNVFTEKLSSDKKIAILIPCYNESQTIEKVVKDYKKVLPTADIYVYDNNSTDGTAEIAEKAGAIVRHEYRQGKGNVIRSMFRDINADAYLMIDGDDTYPAEDAPKMIQLVLEGKADMVVGDRLSSTYFKENKRPFHNFGNRIVRLLINKLFNNDIKDVMTGYRAFSYDFVKGFPVLSKGFEIETEMTIHAVDKNFKVIEIPVQYRDRPEGSESKLSTYSDGCKVLVTIASLFKDYKPGAFFGILSMVLAVVGIIIGIPAYVGFFQTGLVEKIPSLIVSCFALVAALLLFITAVILQVIIKKEKQRYELYLNGLNRDKLEK